jgi:hypothetical protein
MPGDYEDHDDKYQEDDIVRGGRRRRRNDDPDEDDDRGPDIRRRRGSGGQEINNYLAPAILCTLFCCLPLGIVAIVNAAQVNGKLAAGDYEGAQNSANQAKTYCWVSFGLGLVISLVYLAVYLSNPRAF